MKISNYLKACCVHFSRAQSECLICDIHPEFRSGDTEGQYRGSILLQRLLWREPLRSQFDHGLAAFHGHFVPGLVKVPLIWPLSAVFLDQAHEEQQSLGHTVLLASWSRKIFPLVASSPVQSHIITTIDLIWNYMASFCQWLGHALGNVRGNASRNRQCENSMAVIVKS